MIEQDQTNFENKRNREVFELMTTIQGNFKTIADLLAKKVMVTDYKDAFKAWLLVPCFDNARCSVGVVTIEKKDVGPCEEHVHPESIEYLILTSGSLLVNIAGQNIKVLTPGECISIQAKVPHFSTPLEDNTEMIYVTVPKDHNIPSLTKDN